MSSGANHVLARVTESVRGTTPSTPTFEIIRHNKFTGRAPNMTGARSEELRQGRHISNYRNGPKRIEFDCEIELSYGSYDNILAKLFQSSWSTNVLKTGSTRGYDTIESYISDLTGNPYTRLTGCEYNEWSQTVTAGDAGVFVKGNFKGIGYDAALDSAIVSGATYSAVSTTVPFDAFTCTLTEGGSPIAIVTEINWSLKNGLVPQYVVGSTLAALPDNGTSDLTGQITCQFNSTTLLEKFINQTATDIVLVLTDTAGNDLQIDFPNIRYSGATTDISGPGTIPIVLPFQALYSTGDASNIVLTRTPA